MTTTLPLTDTAKRRLQEVAEWLEAGAPHKNHDDPNRMIGGFGMDVGVAFRDCGAVCCIAGALVQFNSPRLPDDALECGEVPWKQVLILATELLGLEGNLDNRRLTDRLFRSNCDNEWITPAIAAEVIRHLIATGEVDWDRVWVEADEDEEES